MNRTFAEIDLQQLRKNLSYIKSLLQSKTKIMGVVKADAYGHGLLPVAEVLIQQGVEFLGVATIAEAVELRKKFKKVPILVLSEPDSKEATLVSKYKLIQTIYTYDFAEKLARASKQPCPVHIKVDTGMNRIGLMPNEVSAFIERLSKLKNIFVEGLFTHFACADKPGDPLNDFQINTFKQVVAAVKPKLKKLKYVHAANSAAVQNFKASHFDLVRVGISLYKNVLSFKSRVAYVKTVKSGSPISYGSTFITKRETKVATVSAGYADGYSRLLSNKGKVLINGQEYPIIGTICMDMFMVDVSGSSVKIGDEVVLIGRSGDKQLTAQYIANLLNTIDYEVLCNVSKRVPRVYLG